MWTVAQIETGKTTLCAMYAGLPLSRSGAADSANNLNLWRSKQEWAATRPSVYVAVPLPMIGGVP